MLFLFFPVLLLIAYGILIGHYRRAWNRLPEFSEHYTRPAKVTVVIPARNEEKYILSCLQSIARQEKQGMEVEVLVVDDHSADRTAELVKSFPLPGLRLIALKDYLNPGDTQSFKKKAIDLAVQQAAGDLIICTDADCTMDPGWIESIVSCWQSRNAAFIAAPVSIAKAPGLLAVFQALDFISLQGVTGAAAETGSFAMCNGANLAYSREKFWEVGGFEGIDRIASGDDMLLMEKFRQAFPEKIFFLKNPRAIVTTQPLDSWPGFFRQRLRWTSKAGNYTEAGIRIVLFFVFLLNLVLLACGLASFLDYHWFIYFAGLVILKTLLEFRFVYSVALFFGQTRLMKYFFWMQPLHILYTVLAAILGQFGHYRWKGRRVR